MARYLGNAELFPPDYVAVEDFFSADVTAAFSVAQLAPAVQIGMALRTFGPASVAPLARLGTADFSYGTYELALALDVREGSIAVRMVDEEPARNWSHSWAFDKVTTPWKIRFRVGAPSRLSFFIDANNKCPCQTAVVLLAVGMAAVVESNLR